MGMPIFEFFSVPRIIFGSGTFARSSELASSLGKRAMIVHNGDDALAERLAGQLVSTALRVARFRQRGEPKIADVTSALAVARRENCDFVIGLGGGSAIDCAKAVAALLTNGGEALDYMEVVGKGQVVTRPAAPWIAIPTTAGTGAEVTRNAVIAVPERKFKASIRGPHLMARIALIDPELGISTPPAVIAASGMDALCQCIESYTSSGAQPMTDALALKGIEIAARSIRFAWHDPQRLQSREDMSLAALLSGMTLTNAGLGAVHGFAAPLGANFPVPHGVVCAALLSHVINANVAAARAASENNPVLRRYADVGRLLLKSKVSQEIATISDALAADAAGEVCAQFAKEMHMPSLGNYGIGLSDIPAMIELAKKSSSMRFNPVMLSDEALGAILRAAI